MGHYLLLYLAFPNPIFLAQAWLACDIGIASPDQSTNPTANAPPSSNEVGLLLSGAQPHFLSWTKPVPPKMKGLYNG